MGDGEGLRSVGQQISDDEMSKFALYFFFLSFTNFTYLLVKYCRITV